MKNVEDCRIKFLMKYIPSSDSGDEGGKPGETITNPGKKTEKIIYGNHIMYAAVSAYI